MRKGRPPTDVQAVVVGAGHNGLICGAYLARAGMRVTVLDARDGVGGCAATVDALGARVNICNCDHTMIRATPIVDELGLEGLGLRYLELDPIYTAVTWRGDPPWMLHHSLRRTLEGLGRAYPSEVEGYRRYVRAAGPVAALLLDMANAVPTPGSAVRRLLHHPLSRVRAAATLLPWSRRSVASVLKDFFSEEALIAPMVTAGPAVWGLPPETPGTGLGAIGFAMRHQVATARPVGGSGALPEALAAALRGHGGTVRLGARVTEVMAEGRVRGVRLSDGEVIDASVVVVACDPRPLFMDWLVSASTDALVARYRNQPGHDGYEAKVDAIVRRPPRLRALESAQGDSGVEMSQNSTIVVSPTLAEMDAAHHLLRMGHVAARPMLLVNTPSVLDPTMQPASGSHVLSMEALWTPYELQGGWERSSEPARWIRAFADLVEPGFLEGVERWRLMGPREYESQFLMPRGYAPSFAGTPVSALRGRDPELTRYETPVPGLYLTGAATFPGAGIWGASGRNAAHVILRQTH